jgi:hypothetical protein
MRAPEYTEGELNAMTKAELLALAEELGLDGLSMNNLKAEIVSAILNR